MALVDEVTIRAEAGKGGDGVVRWLHIKGKEKGGPAGGDGGRGGDVVLEGVADLEALARYRFEKSFKAVHGAPGGNRNRHGEDGTSCVLHVPVGTTAQTTHTGEEVEINAVGERIVVYKGGAGGRGNAHFKSSTNQNPFTATKGKMGEGGDIVLILKLIADIGLVGLPNAGKSSLLNALTHAKSKVGAYPFTTLEPALGDFYGRIIADIPGLIEGASAGRGLGHKFLKHVEKTRVIVHLVSAEQDDPLSAYREVRKELETFGAGLSTKREIVLLSKTDLISAEEYEKRQKQLSSKTGREVLGVSITDPGSLKALSHKLTALLASS
ncbi:hypothetical protein A3H77_00445 [Candidatus Kaiserbacteria bacterium RIFCSPLOWO2_02_FULL_56_11]|nr:MAG: hypothetical protein A3H77_00445 [Candidatus Kaiserbacteria bacterium RIFCSPLOWO2_02_FULL_56_11]